MAYHNGRADVVAAISVLRKQQFESEIDATYLGWTLKTKIAQERRLKRIALLVGILDDIDTPTALNDGTSKATP